MSIEEECGTLTTADGVNLFWRAWSGPEPKAVVILVHGLSEHSGRYRETGAAFASAGLAVLAADSRGHGRSDGLRIHVDDFNDYLCDVRAAAVLARQKWPHRPVVLLGHSQGGLIVLLTVLRRAVPMHAAVVTSPFLDIHPSSRPALPLRLLAPLVAATSPTTMFDKQVEPEKLSHDPEVALAYRSDPLIGDEVSAGWFAAARRAMREVMHRAGQLTVPVLVHQAGDDRTVDPEATRRWVAAAPKMLVTYREWDGLWHELLNEVERREVRSEILQWIDRRALSGR